MAHIALIVSYICRWEHRVTLPFTPRNTDFWSVVLSASLQAFYTATVLVFLTQRLALSRALRHRLKLTSIHDISGAWSGLGSALSSVWKQTAIRASVWTTTAVTAYLVCISVLHVTSSTLLQFQTFNTTMATNVSTTLGWVDISNPYVPWADINWGTVTASLPAISQFSGIVSPGLSNSTVYDIPQTTSVVGLVTVNATTVTSSCGLIPNVTYSQNNNTAHASFGNGSVLFLTISPPWMDQIQVLQFEAGLAMNDPPSALPSVLLMVSTLLEIEPSVQKEVAVPVTVWESPCAFDFCNVFTITNLSAAASQSIDIYFVQCSLSTNNTTVVIDMQTDTLQNPIPVPQSSTQWEEMDQWTSTEWSVYVR
ncbi:hypothetical protein P692DRAFT_20710186 [Suillus brevipes Sb2]|nr:hypothetical protein P692DRAFT_20710186 [Suillus brevipes Sb2]